MANAVYPVPAMWAEKALIDEARYEEMYARSLGDPEGFWRDEAR
ncbi:hypothetical protein SAMN05518801_1041, partial [Novosphingobium sp. CF614]